MPNPSNPRNAREDHEAGRIPTSRFFDITDIADKSPGALGLTMPPIDLFTQKMRDLSVRKTDRIVVYDFVGMFTAPRVWWMLTNFGAEDVAVLNGGMKKWLKEGRPVETGPENYEKGIDGDYSFVFREEKLARIRDVYDVVDKRKRGETQELILDARGAQGF